MIKSFGVTQRPPAVLDNLFGPPCVDPILEVGGEFLQELALISDGTVPLRVDEPAVINRLLAIIAVLLVRVGLTFELSYVHIGPWHNLTELDIDLFTKPLEIPLRVIQVDVCIRCVLRTRVIHSSLEGFQSRPFLDF